MKLVVVILTVMSWAACNVGAPEGAAKFTPVKKRTNNLILRDFILAPAQQKGYSPQAFVVVAHYDPVRPKIVVSIQAINHDGIQASPREGSCVDRYVKRGFRHHKKNTITINKGRKKIKLKFTSDGSRAC